MNLRQWYANSFIQDTWRVNPTTTINLGLRYEFMSPLTDISNRMGRSLRDAYGSDRLYRRPTRHAKGSLLRKQIELRAAHRSGEAVHGIESGIPGAYGIFYTPVDMNTWCNNLHNVPIIFPETNQSDAFTPSITSLNFGPAIVGQTVTSFTAFDPYQKAQYVQQWTASLQRTLGSQTVIEIGYQGDRGFHLQRAHLINNPLPGPGLIQPRRPYRVATFLPGTVFPAGTTVVSNTIPVSTVNWLENTAQSWYDAGYVNVRRRYASGLSILANYTYAKNLTNAPDFRSPMFEAAVPQNNNNLDAEKGPGCDIRNRLAVSLVYDAPSLNRFAWSRVLTRNWQLSGIYQAQSGFPLTISVFGDTANTGTVLGENPVRANYTGQPVFTAGTRTAQQWFNPLAFAAPAPYTFGNVGRNTVYGPGLQTLDVAVARNFHVSEQAGFVFRIEAFNGLEQSQPGNPESLR